MDVFSKTLWSQEKQCHVTQAIGCMNVVELHAIKGVYHVMQRAEIRNTACLWPAQRDQLMSTKWVHHGSYHYALLDHTNFSSVSHITYTTEGL